jgi:apolipoprotein N-acyltransferase
VFRGARGTSSSNLAVPLANLLLVPTWDFNLDRWLHARMAVLRAVENGFALARSARNGLFTLSDNRGRILATNGNGVRPFRLDYRKSKRYAGKKRLCAGWRLVCLALRGHVCRPPGHTPS